MTNKNAPITFRKRIRRAWNWINRRGGAVEAAEWCNYDLVFSNSVDDPNAVRFRLRQCPKCGALVQPTNDKWHMAWHVGGSV